MEQMAEANAALAAAEEAKNAILDVADELGWGMGVQ